MKNLFASLALVASTLVPAQAQIHDFSPENSAPAVKPAGDCYYTSDKSQVCWQRENLFYAVAIYDIDLPNQATSVVMNCNTGQWKSYGNLPKPVLNLYMDGFCNDN